VGGSVIGQITIYLDDDSERRVRLAARHAGVSVSRWVVRAIEASEPTTWPQSIRQLPGSWDDGERQPQASADIEREVL
jgi:hypothetical protein